MKINLCIIGNSFPGRFIDSLFKLKDYCSNKGILLNLNRTSCANIYKGRDMCLHGEAFSPPEAKPFNGEKYDYILWIDSDQVFKPSDLINLIDADKQVIGAAIRQTDMLYASGRWNKQGDEFDTMRLTKELLDNSEEPIEVDFTGFGFLLVKYGVYEQMTYPWHRPRYYDSEDTEEYMSEDGSWCKELHRLGIQIYIHPKVRVGHLKEFEIPA